MPRIYLRSSDDQPFWMEEGTAKLSLKLKQIIEVKDRVNDVIKIDNVKGVTLTKVIDYCRNHIISNDDAEALKLFDQEFVRNVDEVSMMYLTNAAKDLEIESLYELCYPALIDKLKGKTLHEIMDMFYKEDLDQVTGICLETVFRSLDLK
ncbi:SKP1-like protein 4 [Artemisia annua]|uniref:SKP1-like protein n=1 Tax=Artemisia annua TaxID=35608 RepID=A0A2U1P7M3_ARTAN|nr:SKP1-like protein 4 [Artemisia annua]